MSRIGKRAIKIDKSVKLSIDDKVVCVESEKGKAKFNLPSGISVKLENDVLFVNKSLDSKLLRSLHGTTARVIANMIKDVGNGYKKILEFKGTGYRAKVENDKLILNMGYSHDLFFPIEPDIAVSVVKNKIITEGVDRIKIGQFCAKVRKVRPPEVYKGKGIKYDNELIKKKAGKAAQTVSGK